MNKINSLLYDLNDIKSWSCLNLSKILDISETIKKYLSSKA